MVFVGCSDFWGFGAFFVDFIALFYAKNAKKWRISAVFGVFLPYSIHIDAVVIGGLLLVGRPVPEVMTGTEMYSGVTVPDVPVVKT